MSLRLLPFQLKPTYYISTAMCQIFSLLSLLLFLAISGPISLLQPEYSSRVRSSKSTVRQGWCSSTDEIIIANARAQYIVPRPWLLSSNYLADSSIKHKCVELQVQLPTSKFLSEWVISTYRYTRMHNTRRSTSIVDILGKWKCLSGLTCTVLRVSNPQLT